MRLVNEKLLKSFKGRQCEVCRRTYGVVAHHVFYRSSGRMDVDINLVALCWKCHTNHHAGQNPTTVRCLEAVAERYGTTWEKVRELLYLMRRTPGRPGSNRQHSAEVDAILRECLNGTETTAPGPGHQCLGPVHRPRRRVRTKGVLPPQALAGRDDGLALDPHGWQQL